MTAIPPERGILRPDELGTILSQKDWKELFYIIQGKDDNGRPTPVARLMGGKIVLFPYEYHADLKNGTTWECKIVEDNPTFVRAIPLRQIAGIKVDGDALPPLPPDLAKIFVEALRIKRAEAVPLLQTAEKEIGECSGRIESAEMELSNLEKRMSELEDAVTELQSTINLYDKALNHYEPQAECSPHEIEQEFE